MSYNSDILVIGAGPAGLSFCSEFAGKNVKIIVVELIGATLDKK